MALMEHLEFIVCESDDCDDPREPEDDDDEGE
jgi:hypothetical protein